MCILVCDGWLLVEKCHLYGWIKPSCCMQCLAYIYYMHIIQYTYPKWREERVNDKATNNPTGWHYFMEKKLLCYVNSVVNVFCLCGVEDTDTLTREQSSVYEWMVCWFLKWSLKNDSILDNIEIEEDDNSTH